MRRNRWTFLALAIVLQPGLSQAAISDREPICLPVSSVASALDEQALTQPAGIRYNFETRRANAIIQAAAKATRQDPPKAVDRILVLWQDQIAYMALVRGERVCEWAYLSDELWRLVLFHTRGVK